MKKRSSWKVFLALAAMSILGTSCGNSFEQKEIPTDFTGIGPVDGSTGNAITFAEIKAQILEPSCIACHSNFADYNSFNGMKEAAMGAISSGRMPKNAAPLSNELKTLMRSWLAAGAPETQNDVVVTNPGDGSNDGGSGGNRPPTVDLLEPTWSSISKKIIFPKCISCHGAGSFLPLASRQDFFDQRDELLNDFNDIEDSKLIKRLESNTNPMPPTWSGIEKLTTEEINVVIQWVEQGLPN